MGIADTAYRWPLLRNADVTCVPAVLLLRGCRACVNAARVCNNFQSSWSVLTSNEKVLLLGLIQSCFESAMFIFVFMWTPAMEATLPANTKVCVNDLPNVQPAAQKACPLPGYAHDFFSCAAHGVPRL